MLYVALTLADIRQIRCIPGQREFAPGCVSDARGGKIAVIGHTMRQRLPASSEDHVATRYDRKAEVLGNVVMLEHVNRQIPDRVI